MEREGVRWEQLANDLRRVIRYTRRWLLYGLIGFAVACSLIAAVRGIAEGP
jgi:hypothetical protein